MQLFFNLLRLESILLKDALVAAPSDQFLGIQGEARAIEKLLRLSRERASIRPKES